MRLRAQVAYERGRNEAAAEIASLTERLASRDQQFDEQRKRAETASASLVAAEAEVRVAVDAKANAEARVALLPRYEQELQARTQQMAAQQKELTALHSAVSTLTARLEESQRIAADAKAALDERTRQMAEQHANFTAKLEEVQRAALAAPAAAAGAAAPQLPVGDIVEPLKQSLEQVDARIVELERERTAAFAALQQQVESMLRAQANLQSETAHLAAALRTPAARGRWGEVQLRRVVELAGMIEHCDFTDPGADGAADRPDLLIQLPNRRQIVVDAKLPAAAYLESCETADEALRNDKRREWAAQVREHVARLSDSEYWARFPQSPEFVVAFLPGEAFFSAALEQDPALLEFGVERRVVLATPTTLIALLRAVAWGWKQELVSTNAREVRDLGKALYDRLRSFAGDFIEIQRGLTRATAAYNRTVGGLESSVIPAARRLRDLGAGGGDEIASPAPVDTTPRSLHLLAEATDTDSPAVASAPEAAPAA